MTTRRLLVDDRQPSGESANDPVWRRIRDIIRAINNSIILPGILLTEELGARTNTGLAFVAATPRTIAHRLGRKAVGFIEIQGADLPSPSIVGLAATAFPSGFSSDSYISVTPANTGTCFVWVF